MDWQKEDIEYAIGSYLDTMSAELYDKLSQRRQHYLRQHEHFGDDLAEAVELLETMLEL